MAKINVISIVPVVLLILNQLIGPSVSAQAPQGGRGVLIRDRLVFLLCDQIDEYLTTGNFPAAAKKLPDKYKSVKPGVTGSMNGFKVVTHTNKRKRQSDWEQQHPILDFIFD